MLQRDRPCLLVGTQIVCGGGILEARDNSAAGHSRNQGHPGAGARFAGYTSPGKGVFHLYNVYEGVFQS